MRWKMFKGFLRLLGNINYIGIYIIYNNIATVSYTVATAQLNILLFV